MTITFVCDVLGEENNGTTIATMNVIRAMKKKGHTVRIVCPDEDKEGKEGYYVVRPLNWGMFNNYVKKNGVVLATTRDMEIVKEALTGADLVHFNFCGKLSSKVVDMAHSMGIPCTASLHTQAENFTNHVFLDHSKMVNDGLYHVLYKNLFSKVDAIHYPSQFIHDLFEKKNHFHGNGYVISNGIQSYFKRENLPRPAALTNKFVIVYTARYSKEKVHKVLIKAMKYSKYRKQIVLILPGAGPLEKKLKKWGEKYCFRPPVLGFHSREEMVKILNMADLYCHVGRVDIEPVSCLEAISVGICPVLTDSKLSSVSSFALSEKNIFKHGDSKDLANKIDYWLEHPEERKECADSYLGFAKKFDFETSMNKMEEMFLKTIEDYKNKETK